MPDQVRHDGESKSVAEPPNQCGSEIQGRRLQAASLAGRLASMNQRSSPSMPSAVRVP